VNGINSAAIVKRIVDYLPHRTLNGLTEITLFGSNEECFGCYIRDEKRIELYLEEIVGWQPWLLKKTYVFPVMCIGLILGHEIDHYVNRENPHFIEEFPSRNTIQFIVPSLGIFRHLIKPLSSMYKFYFRRNNGQENLKKNNVSGYMQIQPIAEAPPDLRRWRGRFAPRHRPRVFPTA